MNKKLIGKVVSDKMEKTVVVSVGVTYVHRLYKKRYRRSRKYYADNQMGAKLGDSVVIEQTRPLSKLKCWRVVEIKKA